MTALVLEAALGLLTGLGMADRHGRYDLAGPGPPWPPGSAGGHGCYGLAGGPALSVFSKRLPLTAYLFPKSESESENRFQSTETSNQLQKSISETANGNRKRKPFSEHANRNPARHFQKHVREMMK